MDLIQIITQILAGAFTGYTTNSLAIKMLFKNYGPFGGVIVKTRKEFIENISQLVENDIIKAHTLEKTLKKPEIKHSLEEIIGDFFDDIIAREIHLGDINGINNTYQNFTEYVAKKGNGYFQEGIEIISPAINFAQLITPEEFSYLSKKINSQIIKLTAESIPFQREIDIFFSEINDKKISSFFAEDFLKELNSNLKYLFKESQNNNNIKELTGNFISDIYSIIKVEKLQKEIYQKIKDKSLKDYNFKQKYFINLKEKCIEILNRKESKDSLTSIINKNQEINLKSFINDEMNIEINKLSAKKSKLITNELNQWLSKNQTSVNDIFNKLINDTFEEEALRSPFKTKIKKSAYQLYQNNNQLNFSEVLGNSLDKLINNEQTQKRISNYILEKIKDIKHDTDPEILAEKIISETINNLQDISDDFTKELENLKISELIDLNKLPELMDLIKNKNIQELIYNILINRLDNYLLTFSNQKLAAITENIDSKIINKKISSFFENQQKQIENILKEELYDKYKDRPLSSLNINLENTNLEQKIENFVGKQKKKFCDIELKQVYDKITGYTAYQDKLSTKIIDYISGNLEFLLQGNISSAIKNNLEKISDEEIKDILEDFVGKELKPITYFGALLGIITAFLLYLLQLNFHLDSNLYIPVSMLVYGFIGYITNVIAIKMIFKPYQKKTLLGIPIPFTPGVVSKEKERFAQSVGDFIDQELLNHQTIKNTIQDKEKIIREIFISSIKADEYKLLSDFIGKSSGKLATSSINYLGKNQNKIINSLLINKDANTDEMINKYLLNKENISEYLSDNIVKNLMRLFEENIPLLANKLNLHLKNKEYVSDIIPAVLKENINKKINSLSEENLNEIIKILNNHDENYLEKVISKVIKHIYQDFEEKTISEIPAEMKNGVIEFSYKLLSKFTLSKSNIIRDKINKLLLKESDLLLDGVPDLLNNNKGYIKENIKKAIESKMGFWSTAGKLVDFEETLDIFSDKLIKEGIPQILDLYLSDEKNILLEKIQLERKDVENLLSVILNNKDTINIYKEIIDSLIENYSDVSIQYILEFLEIKEPSKLV
ncbi:MAG: DUF445 family protein, partial [Halanaerobiaceae bacterium]